jgi:hypothetical protein
LLIVGGVDVRCFVWKEEKQRYQQKPKTVRVEAEEKGSDRVPLDHRISMHHDIALAKSSESLHSISLIKHRPPTE